jgi:predicted dehydrogenase
MGEIEEVSCFSNKISDLDIETEDTAEILLKFKNGAIAEVHLDITRHDFSRIYELICEKGTIIWDYVRKLVKVYSAKSRQWQTFNVDVRLDEMYVQEIKHFIRCVLGKEAPLIDGEDARKTLRIALVAKRSAETGKVIKV